MCGGELVDEEDGKAAEGKKRKTNSAFQIKNKQKLRAHDTQIEKLGFVFTDFRTATVKNCKSTKGACHQIIVSVSYRNTKRPEAKITKCTDYSNVTERVRHGSKSRS